MMYLFTGDVLQMNKRKKIIWYLNGFLVEFVWTSAKLLQSSVRILTMDHDDVGTTTRGNHLPKPQKNVSFTKKNNSNIC